MKKPDLILGKDLLERWNIDSFSLLQKMKQGLQPQGGSFNTQVQVARLLLAKDIPKDLGIINMLQFSIEEVIKFESINLKSLDILKCPDGTKWEDIKITIVDDETVSIKTPNGKRRFTYHQIGLADGRSSNKPTILWKLLKIFAQSQGKIKPNTDDYRPELPDTAKRLNKHLQGLFGISDSIYRGHYKAKKGYETKIFFSDKTGVI